MIKNGKVTEGLKFGNRGSGCDLSESYFFHAALREERQIFF